MATLKTVTGWTCDCVQPDDNDGHFDPHNPAQCPRRRPTSQQIPTEPGWKMPPPRAAAAAEEIELPPPEVPARPARGYELPKPAADLLVGCWRAGVPAGVTYARGWTLRRVRDEAGAAAGRVTVDVPVRVESIALRCSRLVAVWRRRELEPGSGVSAADGTGWEAWDTPEAWVHRSGQVMRVKITEAKRWLKGEKS